MTKVLGVTRDVQDAMSAVEASVVAEDGMLFRVCEHGQRHPVGHLHRLLNEDDWKRRHHERGEPVPFTRFAQCCGCCAAWAFHAPQPADAEQEWTIREENDRLAEELK